MALRISLGKRFLCTSMVSSQFSTSALVAAAEAARNKPAPIPSDTLFVSGLNKRTMNEKLHEALSKFEPVDHAKVATDRNSGYSKGYEFSMEQWRRKQKGLEEYIQSVWKAGLYLPSTRGLDPHREDRLQDAYGARNRWYTQLDFNSVQTEEQ